MLGNLLLALPVDGLFYPGLAVIAIGTGLLKPNISTIVGQLYTTDDPRRDAGYTIYYMGINIGAFFGPILCGFFAQSDTFRSFLADQGIDPKLCWHFAFGVVTVGMAGGLAQYLIGWRRLGDAGIAPTIPDDPKRAARDRTVLGVIIGGLAAIIALFIGLSAAGVEVSKATIGNIFGVGLLIAAVGLFIGLLRSARNPEERSRIVAILSLFVGAIAFFAAFEQASSTLSLYTERFVRREWLGISIPASYWQSLNSVYVILLAPVAAWVWVSLARSGREPMDVKKFSIGMVITALSFAVFLPSVGAITELKAAYDLVDGVPYLESVIDAGVDPMRVSGNYLVIYYLGATLAELCISPVGLSSMSKLAPQRMAGMVMGTWFLATAIGNYLAGRAAGFSAARGYGFLFYTLIIGALIVAAALYLVAPTIKRMMAGSAGLPKASVVQSGDKADKKE
jgi:POT family proton-dependent oligopeptide transporter